MILRCRYFVNDGCLRFDVETSHTATGREAEALISSLAPGVRVLSAPSEALPWILRWLAPQELPPGHMLLEWDECRPAVQLELFRSTVVVSPLEAS
jgi:hypothetical protein